jgi:hypothetical protein
MQSMLSALLNTLEAAERHSQNRRRR